MKSIDAAQCSTTSIARGASTIDHRTIRWIRSEGASCSKLGVHLDEKDDLLKIFHPLDHREWTFSSSSKIMEELELFFFGNLLLALQAWDSSSELDSWWIRKIPEFLQLALWLTACDWTRSMHLRSLGSYKLLPFSNSFKCLQILSNASKYLQLVHLNVSSPASFRL